MDAVADKLRTVKPFEVCVAGVRLKAWLNGYKRIAWIEREDLPAEDGAVGVPRLREAAVAVAEMLLARRVERYMGEGWTVMRGEGW